MKPKNAAAMLAGWLFADSMLALMLIALAGEPAQSDPAVPPSATPTVSVSAAPSPSPARSRTAARTGVEQRAVIARVDLGGTSDAAVRAAIRRQFAPIVDQRRRAAFVLTFGTAASPGTGVELAHRTNRALVAAAPEVFAASAQRDFWQAINADEPRAGVVRIEVYLFSK